MQRESVNAYSIEGIEQRNYANVLGVTIDAIEMEKARELASVWRAIVRGVGLAEHIQVIADGMVCVGRINRNGGRLAAGEHGSVAQAIKIRLRNTFDPDMKLVSARRNRMNGERACGTGNIVQRSGQCDYDGTHLRMNIAEDEGDPFVRKRHLARASTLIQTQIEALAVEEGKHIVKEGIFVRKADHAADRNDEQMRNECPILLNEGEVSGRRRLDGRRVPDRCKPHDRRRRMRFSSLANNDVSGEFRCAGARLLRTRRDEPGSDCEGGEQSGEPGRSLWHGQNLYPAATPITSLNVVGAVT